MRRFGIAERPMDRAEIGEGFNIIGFGGKRLLDQAAAAVCSPR